MQACGTDYKFKVTWEPFLLRPNLPPEGVPKPPNYGPGTPGSQRLIDIGKSVGIEFTYKQSNFPSTVVGHCALEYALQKDQSGKIQNELQEALFNSYFTVGDYPSAECVSDLASSVGLDKSEVLAYVSDPVNQQKVREKAAMWSARSVSGVPNFIMNNQPTFSGAQSPQTMQQVFGQVAERFPIKEF